MVFVISQSPENMKPESRHPYRIYFFSTYPWYPKVHEHPPKFLPLKAVKSLIKVNKLHKEGASQTIHCSKQLFDGAFPFLNPAFSFLFFSTPHCILSINTLSRFYLELTTERYPCINTTCALLKIMSPFLRTLSPFLGICTTYFQDTLPPRHQGLLVPFEQCTELSASRILTYSIDIWKLLRVCMRFSNVPYMNKTFFLIITLFNVHRIKRNTFLVHKQNIGSTHIILRSSSSFLYYFFGFVLRQGTVLSVLSCSCRHLINHI